MLLNQEEFKQFADRVAELPNGRIAHDLETTGLNVHRGDKAFLIGVAHAVLGKASCFLDWDCSGTLARLHSNPRLLYASCNSKFELSFFRHQFNHGVLGKVFDNEVMERVLHNNYWKRGSYGLQGQAERRGWSKHEPMLAWLKANGPKYHEAPHELIIPYVEQDAWLSLALMEDQIETFKSWDVGSPVPVRGVIKLEMLTTPALFEMESQGISVDIPYCKEALAYEQKEIAAAKADFHNATGVEFVDSAKSLGPIFDRLGLARGRAPKGGESFAEDVIGPPEHPVVKAILRHRRAAKRAATYWENFIALVCPDGRLHPDIHQTGAKTSRMSVRDPACQTWPRDDDDEPGDEGPYPIRRAFVTSDPDCMIVSADYSQMELRLMADEAGEMGMIDAFKTGKDFHQETADQAGVRRSLAKNGRFAKLYGSGVPRLAATLGVDVEIARKISRAIEESSPRITDYTWELIQQARTGFGYNWLGRRYFFDSGFEYKSPNYRIQGGCGEILRIAIVEVTDFLRKSARPQTRILLPVHDELVMQFHKDDLHLIADVKRIMIAAHRSKRHLDMDVSVHVGKNFYDLEPHVC